MGSNPIPGTTQLLPPSIMLHNIHDGQQAIIGVTDIVRQFTGAICLTRRNGILDRPERETRTVSNRTGFVRARGTRYPEQQDRA